ncbi:MAG: multicopper oxidase domain-containing protein [Pseudonocardiaceae bacterium]
MQRRDMLKIGALAGVSVALQTGFRLQAANATPLPILPFQVPLTVPPVARPVMSTRDTDTYQITMRKADVEIIPGTRTRIWGYDGIFPGPTIKARTGKRVLVQQRNELDVDTSVHLHGGNTPPSSDGHPTDLIKPRSTKSYYYPNAQPAAPLWYHEHAHHNEARGVYMGLAGLYLISDELEDSLRLPRDDYDVPLVIADRLFAPDGSVVLTPADEVLHLRKTILVNGRPQPYFPVAARKYRFRLVNASNERIYRLHVSTGQEMVQIASDSGLLPEPVAVSSIELWPAERAEIIVDFSRCKLGTRLILKNAAGEDPLTQTLMRFDVVRTAPDDSQVPDTLRPLPPADKPATEREFVMSLNMQALRFEINHKPFDPDRVDVRPRLGSTEVWKIYNADTALRIPHTFHTHLARFRVLDRDGKPPRPGETGLKDTVSVRPGETVRILPRFVDFTGRYVYHCHLLGHADNAMMATMEVVH